MSLYEIIWVFIAAVLLRPRLFCRCYSKGGPQLLIVALLGDDVILPCSLKTPIDASGLQLEWARTDLSPGFIHVWEKNKENVEFKQPSYVGRTSLSSDRLKHGDVSLTLFKVQLSDEGPYRCFVPQLPLELFVGLNVGSVSAPVLKVISNHSSRVVLQCESAGWYPEPELLWLDGEGNLLPAGPSETLRGPDDLYTVSSRVTVEKKHSNNITCRVQQKNINQSRETHIHVPGEAITDSPLVSILLVIFACVLFIILAVAAWELNQSENRNTEAELEEGNCCLTHTDTKSRMKGIKEDSASNQLENGAAHVAMSEIIRQNEKNKEAERQMEMGCCYMLLHAHGRSRPVHTDH